MDMPSQHNQHNGAPLAGVNKQPPPIAPPVAFFHNMMVIGLLGSAYGRLDDSEIISHFFGAALEDARPYHIWCAIAQGMGGHSRYAKEVLGPMASDGDELTRLALAISLVFSGDADASKAMEAVLVTTENEHVRQAIHNILEEMRAQRH